uniref:Uncharacterized protein n=1 Tax=Leersia perrieri TaxID=77586 RepID=A0A0D9Y158_9ORYZ
MAKRFDLRRFEDSKGQNLLRLAAKHGCMESCKFLVEESGLDVNSVCHQGDTPVLLAASDGNIDVLTYLLDRGGDPAIPDERGITPLHRAAQYGHVEAITLLLSKGVLVDPMFYGGTPMHLAALQGQDQVLKVLLKHGADPNRVFGHMISPLMTACQARSLKCMKLLIEAGVDVNDRRSGEGITPLEFAVYLGWTDVVKFLLEAGADPNIPGEDGEIPIMVAAANDQRELVEILFPRTKPIPCHPDWSVDGIIRTMRFTCIEPQDAVPVEKLVSDAKSNGKEAFVKGDYLSSMYFYTQALENVPLDATLFANRSLCWLRLREGEKALCDAQQCRTLCPGWSKAWYREGSALSLLKDYEGAVANTPVLLATCDGNIHVLRYLLDRGGDPALPDSRGVTPLHCAARHGHVEAIRLLLSKGLHVDPMYYGGTLLHLAALLGQDQALKVLLEHGADGGVDVNGKSSGEGITPLEFAVHHGWTDVVKFLLEAGADPNIPNEDGEIPIMVPAANGQLPVEKLVSDAKSNGKEAFAKGDYLSSMHYYTQALEKAPLDATLFANRSLCWLRLGEGDSALLDARNCRRLRPGWSKAWTDYKGAVGAFVEALKLDPVNDEIENAFRTFWNRRSPASPAMALSPTAATVFQAAIDGNLHILRKMAKKVDLRGLKDNEGLNALHFAANHRHLESCKFMVEELGLDVNSVSNTGRTPILLSSMDGSIHVLRYLLDCGGDPTIPDDKGAGADVNGNSFTGPRPTPLAVAVNDGSADIVKLLLGAGADPNIPNEHGRIPIMEAAARGQRELVEILFPRTKPILCFPDWSVNGIISTMKFTHIKPQDAVTVEEQVSDAKSKGKEAFGKGDYLIAIYFYTMCINPHMMPPCLPTGVFAGCGCEKETVLYWKHDAAKHSALDGPRSGTARAQLSIYFCNLIIFLHFIPQSC